MRLAFRREGQWWNAYVAKPDTMDDAVHIGSIAMTIVEENEGVKKAFMATMQWAFGSVLDVTVIDWNEPQPAPEAERAGHG